MINAKTNAQEFPNLINSKTVSTITYWEEDESQSYHFKTIKETFKNDRKKPENQIISEYDIEIHVVEEADSFYILEMVYSNFTFQSSDKKKQIRDQFSGLQDGMKIRYRTNEIGQFDTILNLPELAKELETQFKIVADEIKDDLPEKMTETQFESIIKFLIDRFTTLENVEVLFLEDILSIHGYFGFEFVQDRPEEFELIFPVFDEVELMGTATVVLTSINKDANSFMINVNSAPSKNELAKYIKQIFESFTMGLLDKKGELSDFKITSKSKARYSFELSSGWPKIINETTTNTIVTKKETLKSISKTVIKMN